MTTVLTAYNRDIQHYMNYAEKSSTARKNKFIELIYDKGKELGKSFAGLFNQQNKIGNVEDDIIFMASGAGIAKVNGATLAKRNDCGIRTVRSAVENLKETGEVLVAGLADGKNKYVFVLKSHENFKEIMKEVFFIINYQEEKTSEKDGNAQLIAQQVAQQENAENIDTPALEGEKTSPNYTNSFNSLNPKQESNIYIALQDEIENDIRKSEDADATVETYFTNSYQYDFYNFFSNVENNLHTEIIDNAVIMGLRLGSNADMNRLRLANQVALKIDEFLKQGGIVKESVPALFSMMLDKGLKMDDYSRIYQKKQNRLQTFKDLLPKVKKVPFYNWVEIRE